MPLALSLLVSCKDPPAEPAPPLDTVDPVACFTDSGCDYVFGVANRGATQEAPENTVLALTTAEARGMDAVLVDVQPTADDVLVLMRDSDLGATTDGSGQLSDYTLDELSAFSVYSRITGVDDQPIPTFAEALDALAPDTLVAIEPQTDRWDLLHADLEASGRLDSAWVQLSTTTQLDQVTSAYPDVLVEPSGETDEHVQLLAPYEPFAIQFRQDLEDFGPMQTALAFGIKPAQDSLGQPDQDTQTGDDPQAIQEIVDRGTLFITSDLSRELPGVLAAINAERGWQRPE